MTTHHKTEWTHDTATHRFRIANGTLHVAHGNAHHRVALNAETLGAPVATRVELLQDALQGTMPTSVLRYTLHPSETALTLTLHHTYRHAADPFVRSLTLHEAPTHVVTYDETDTLGAVLAALPDVTGGKVLTCSLDTTLLRADQLTFRGVLHALYARLPTDTGGRDLVRHSTLNVRTVPPESGRTRGYRYDERLGVSVQGAEANKTLVEAVRWCAHLHVPMTMELRLTHTTPAPPPPKDTTTTVGYIYLLHTRACVNAQQPVYKVGKTRHTIQQRVRGYDKGTRIHCVLPVDVRALDTAERVVLQQLATRFTRRRDYGSEYFEGELGAMTRAMIGVVCQ